MERQEEMIPSFSSCLCTGSGLPSWPSGKEFTCQCRKCKRHLFNSWVGKIPWSRNWQPTQVFFLGKFHGQRSLVGHSPWVGKESDKTEHACTGSLCALRSTQPSTDGGLQELMWPGLLIPLYPHGIHDPGTPSHHHPPSPRLSWIWTAQFNLVSEQIAIIIKSQCILHSLPRYCLTVWKRKLVLKLKQIVNYFCCSISIKMPGFITCDLVYFRQNAI